MGFQLWAQNSLQFKISQVKVDSLVNPFSGGLNAAQFSQIDLNNDQVLDLVAYDRMASKFFTYLANTTGNKVEYLYAPLYETFFPKVENWAMLYDYNMDGNKDLFCYTTFGIMAYINESENGVLKWRLVKDPIFAIVNNQQTNILVNSSDVPALEDIDGDGDMDILSFNSFTGSRIEYYKNLSIENFGHSDSLNFKLVDNCFGGIEEITCGNFNFGLTCQVAKLSNQRIQHVGASSILAFDPDNDGDKDLLISKGECLRISYLQNVGSASSARFRTANYGYPALSPANFYVFPSAFWIDVDLNGKKDLLVTPQVSDNANRLTDTKNSNWLYLNSSTTALAKFDLISKNFLQSKTIDLGENAAPYLVDYDQDEDLDLIVGNKGSKINDTTYASTLQLFKNIGDKKSANFTLDTSDYLGLSRYKMGNYIPQFIDYDQNGSQDLILTTTNFSQLNKTQVVVIYNVGTNKFDFNLDNTDTLDLPINIEDVPCFTDNDGDGDLDALVGKVNGSLLYYENIAGSYSLKITALGGLASNPFKKFLAIQVADFNNDGKQDLLFGENTGIIKVVNNYKEQPNYKISDSTIVYNDLNNSTSTYTFAKRLLFSTGDLNGDQKPDILVGGNTGGLLLLLSSSTLTTLDDWQLSLLPNPVQQYFTIRSNQPMELVIFNIVGQQIATHKYFDNLDDAVQLDLGNLSKGLYILKLSNGKETKTFKILKD